MDTDYHTTLAGSTVSPRQDGGRGGTEWEPANPQPDRREGGHLGIVAISVTNVRPVTPTRVRICSHGTIVSEGGSVRTKPLASGGRRGKIQAWSSKSRARLRKLLAESDGPPDSEPFGFTGTIPGDIVSESDFRRVWQTFRRTLPAVPFVWRVELQTRKQPHVHCVVWAPSRISGEIQCHFMQSWWQAVNRLGETTWIDKKYGECRGRRMAMPGAIEHAVSFSTMEKDDDFGWWRYLASHQGKSKQDQLGWKGRNWGVIHPEKLTSNPGEKYDMTRKQWFWYRRRLRRLTGYRGAGAGCRSVWYVRPDTMRELVTLARLACPL